MALDRVAKGFFSRCHGGFLAVAAAGLFGCHVLSLIYRALVKVSPTNLCNLAFRDLKKIQEDLRKERDFIAAILKTTGATVAVMDPEGRVVRYDPGLEDTGGYSPDEVLGKYVWDCFIPPEDRDANKALFAQLSSSAAPTRRETVHGRQGRPPTHHAVDRRRPAGCPGGRGVRCHHRRGHDRAAAGRGKPRTVAAATGGGQPASGRVDLAGVACGEVQEDHRRRRGTDPTGFLSHLAGRAGGPL